ncbi:MAG: acetate--CoA ligase family protein [Betaproteobacteria bacterium]|nr:acetate--CoA ligase family protein [Betaproteobacteria bacterium]
MSTFEYLFNPRSIAVIGASPEANRPGAQTIRALQDNGFKGGVYPVNPKYGEVAGLRCYAAIKDVPKPCDIAVIALPAALVPQTVDECGAYGVRFVVVVGGGFREMGKEGEEREVQMLAAARKHGVRIVGPNCLGLVNVHTRAYAAFGSLARPPVLQPGPVSVVIQSGGFGNSLVVRCAAAGVGFRQVVASGSESDLTTPELVEAMIDDPGTKLILMYMEGMNDGRRFVAAAERALAAGKPIVVWKAGNTEQGVKAAASHTANMTGSYDIYRAAFRQCGVVEVHEMEEAIDCIQCLLAFGDRPAGDDVAIMGGSGGSAVVFSDAADQYGIRLAELSPPTHTILKKVLPGTASLENPIDYAAGFITDANTPRFREAVDAVLADPAVHQLGVLFATTTGEHARNGATVLAEAVQKHKKPIFTFLSVPRETTGGGMDILEKAAIPILPSPTRVVKAMKVLSDYQRARTRVNVTVQTEAPAVKKYPSGTLSEHESKEILKTWGIAVTTDRLLPATALYAGDAEGTSFPVALKVVSRDIPHKSEIGGVRLNIRNDTELAVAVREMLERVQRAAPKAKLDGLLVSEMITDGIETIVGVVNDSVFGPVVAFGLGGIFAETLKDVTYRLAPFGLETAHEMIAELRASPILSGVRGKPAGDIPALAQTLVAVSGLAWQLRDSLEEMDINPLLVRPVGVIAADALLRFR